MNKQKRAILKSTYEDSLDEVARRFAVKLSPAVIATIKTPEKTADTNDPVARQYLPDIRELDIAPDERNDPIADHAHTPVKGIVHRHQRRALLKASSVCAVNCRFCFRKTMLGTPEETLNKKEMHEALAYIAAHKEMNEVILTGGDPLILSPKRLEALLDALENMDHIKIIRIHSRIPIAAPQRITKEVYKALERKKPLYMVLHINHAQEISSEVEKTIYALHKSGIILLSQSVLLKGVNDNIKALETLFTTLFELRVKPYYLHHLDLTPGTGHFRVDIKKGQTLMRALRGKLSGLAMPSYVLDIPGGYGKVPLEKAHIEKSKTGYIVTDINGNKHSYR